MSTPARRHRFQFSLRTMLVLITLTCAGLGWWAHRSRQWIRQRHEALDRGVVVIAQYYSGRTPAAPQGLWLFGEQGIGSILCWHDDEALARRLFPEAQIFPGAPTTMDDMPPIE